MLMNRVFLMHWRQWHAAILQRDESHGSHKIKLEWNHCKCDASAAFQEVSWGQVVGGRLWGKKIKLFWTAAAITWIDVFPSAIKPSLIASLWLSIGNFHLITTNMVSYLNLKVQPSRTDWVEIYVRSLSDSSGILCHFCIPKCREVCWFLVKPHY